ncbi:pH-sensitive chloride channel 2-like [Artemia franciscana]|uniref:Uncharacterized protein n=1 Tax=Artemia franciscana TaxID=6661 RepID=A0AA88HLN9_ARTSF|nr:hypothetical protein QYM36_009377 [Artemia franciscana]
MFKFTMKSFLLAFWILFTSLDTVRSTNETAISEVSRWTIQIFDEITDQDVYDKREPPLSEGPISVEASVSMTMLSDVDIHESDFSTELWVELSWKDERLAFSYFPDGPEVLQGEIEFAEKIWKPSLYVLNEKQSSVVKFPQANVLIEITPDGHITYSFRLQSKVYCAISLANFPFDVQKCNLHIGSWSLNTDELKLLWKGGEGVNIVQKYSTFAVSKMGVKSWSTTEIGIDGDKHSMLVLEFSLRREASFYLLDFYIPSVIFVFVSWVGLWYGSPNAEAARFRLGGIALFNYLCLKNFTQRILPRYGKYVTALDIFSFAIFIFLLSALCQFAFVNSIWRRRRPYEAKKISTKHILKNNFRLKASSKYLDEESTIPPNKRNSLGSLDFTDDQSRRESTAEVSMKVGDLLTKITHRRGSYSFDLESSVGEMGEGGKRSRQLVPHDVGKYIDRNTRVIFPVAFIIMNVVYWSIVLL